MHFRVSYVWGLTFPEVKSTKWEVDDRRVLLFHKDVLGEPLKVEYNVWWQPLTLVSLQDAGSSLQGVSHRHRTVNGP